MKHRRKTQTLAAAALAALLAAPLSAVTTVWDGGGPVGNTNWNTATNWAGDVVPPIANDVEFASGFGSGITIQTNGNRTANSIVISTTTTFGLAGDAAGLNTLTLTSGNITRNVSGLSQIDVNLVLGANGTWNTGTGTIHMLGPVSQIVAGRSLTKTGSGTLILSGGGNFSGGTAVNQGILHMETASGTGPITVASGARLELDLNNGNIANAIAINGIGPGSLGALRSFTPSTINGQITLQSNATINILPIGPLTLNGAITDGAGVFNLTKQGGGVLQLNAAGTYDGSTIIDDGTITLSHALGLGTGVTRVNSFGTLSVLPSLSVARTLELVGGDLVGASNARWTGPITANTPLSGDESRISSDADFTILGNIDGGGFEKSGAGRVILTGNNTFTSAVVNTGTLSLRSDGAAGGRVTVASGADVEISGSHNFGLSILSLTGAGINNQGAVRVVSGSSTWGGNVQLTGDVPLFVANGAQLAVSGIVAGSSAVLRKIGPGTLVLSGEAQYGGGTFIDAGTLSISSDSNLGPGPINISGTLLFNASTFTSRNFALSGGRLAAEGGATVTVAGSNISGGFIVGPGTFNTQSSATLNGVTALAGSSLTATGTTFFNSFINGGNFSANTTTTWNGGINTSSGRITIGNITLTTTAFSNDGVITINNGVLLNTGNTLTSGGGSRITINPGGALNVTGNALDLNGALLVNNGTITGTTNVNFGSVAKGAGVYGAVNVTDGGRFSPGNSPGSATTGSTTWNSGGSYVVEIADALRADQRDMWFVNGALDIDASTRPFTISLASLDDLIFDFTRDYTWPILHAHDGITGFDPDQIALDLSDFKTHYGSGRFSLQSTETDLLVHFSAVPEPSAILITACAALITLSRKPNSRLLVRRPSC